MPQPDFIDNQSGNTMEKALKALLGVRDGEVSIVEESGKAIKIARIATAYFSPAGFSKISGAVSPIPCIKLMLGTDPFDSSESWKRPIGENENKFYARKLGEGLNKQDSALRIERDNLPFERDISTATRRLVDALKSGNIEVRRYEKNFLHAKSYIFTSDELNEDVPSSAIIAGSSNLTTSGLTKNLELNLGRYDNDTVKRAVDWFDGLWEEAVPFDLAKFFEEMFEARTPYDIFLRVLWELYGDDVEEEQEAAGSLPLTSFQKHGVYRALKLISETGGVIVADEVGLGKSFIAGEIIAKYREKRQRALLICPAALRDASWKSFTDRFELYLEVVSFEQLANDIQLKDEGRRPNASMSHLLRDIEEYQLIIIDEAHNYRNPDSPTRAAALRDLLYGKRKDILMLTATPVNNSLWDLYHLTRFFLKQDSFLASKGILSIRERFDIAMSQNPNDLSPDLLYPIVDATTVKRTRKFIKKHYSGDTIKAPDGRIETIVFPEPKAISVRYKLNSLMPGLFDLVEKYLDPDNEDS